MLGAVEAGGTKFLCAVGTDAGEMADVVEIPTTTPDETLPRVVDFFRAHRVVAVGVASFGPVDLRAGTDAYGTILTTPKPGWQGANIRARLAEALAVPVVVETDVGAAAWAETVYGAGRTVDSLLYVTVGTGIGAALYYRDHIFMTAVHPEMGHIVVRRHPDDRFPGTCPAHGDCLEGLACGKAMEARWGIPPAQLPSSHPAWSWEAYYLAQAVVTYVYMTEPARIVFGGGVMQHPGLLAAVQAEVPRLLNGYHVPPSFSPVEQYVVAPALGREAGLRGALWLAGRLHRGELGRG